MRLLCTLLSTALLIPAIHAAGLNDTGQTSCYNAVDVSAACSAAVGGDAGTNPRQDARYGRDVQAAVGTLSKVGAGAAGFDFTKIANNGTTLPASAALGIATTSWACTKDNVTGLIWEVKLLRVFAVARTPTRGIRLRLTMVVTLERSAATPVAAA